MMLMCVGEFTNRDTGGLHFDFKKDLLLKSNILPYWQKFSWDRRNFQLTFNKKFCMKNEDLHIFIVLIFSSLIIWRLFSPPPEFPVSFLFILSLFVYCHRWTISCLFTRTYPTPHVFTTNIKKTQFIIRTTPVVIRETVLIKNIC